MGHHFDLETQVDFTSTALLDKDSQVAMTSASSRKCNQRDDGKLELDSVMAMRQGGALWLSPMHPEGNAISYVICWLST